MSNSKLVNYTRISPNCNKPRNNKIQKITIHHMAGNLSVEQCGAVFAPVSRQASSNYGIGSDGRVGMYCEEKNRSWCSSSPANDNQAITIEVANDGGAPDWHVSDKALAKLIDLCVDICKRNGIAKLNYTGNNSGNLTRHNMFAKTSCPGPYLQGKFPYIASTVNARLGDTNKPEDVDSDTLYRVQTGAFKEYKSAVALQDKLSKRSYQTYLVQANGLYKVQVGAFAVKENAKALALKLKADGFETYVTTQGGSAVVAKKSIDEIAEEVLAGKWGNGTARKSALTKAGYDYNAVQTAVNKLL